MTKNYKKESFAATVCGLLLLFILLLTSTEALCFWIPNWWRNEYTKYNTPQYVRGEMSMDDAVYVTEQMLEYCIGRLDTLDNVQATIDGRTAPFFTDREKLHLADCRNLFMGAVKARRVSIILIIALLILIYRSISKKKTDAGPADIKGADIDSNGSGTASSFKCVLAKGYLYSLAVTAAIAVLLALIGMHDFTYLFTEFHHVFFDNDLWILYPEEDNLINIMQEAVFADAAVTIAAMWLAAAAVPAVISAVILRRSRSEI